ncbi:MAG: hypothetical protein WEB52_04085 [Dehalococcoidia bacterium]
MVAVGLSESCSSSDSARQGNGEPTLQAEPSPNSTDDDASYADEDAIFQAFMAARLYANANNLLTELDELIEDMGEGSDRIAFGYALEVEIACFSAETLNGELARSINAVCSEASPPESSGRSGVALMISRNADFAGALELTENVRDATLSFLTAKAPPSLDRVELELATVLAGDADHLLSALDDQLDEEEGGVTPFVVSLRATDTLLDCGIVRDGGFAIWDTLSSVCEPALADGFLLSLVSLERYSDARELASPLRAVAACHYLSVLNVRFEACEPP